MGNSRCLGRAATELGYYGRAIGFRNMLTSFFRGISPSLIDRSLAYGNGVWPPFHSLVLSFGLIFGKDPAYARLVVVVL